MKPALIILATLLLSGCSTMPDGSQPAYVKHLKYTPMAERNRDAYYRRANNEYLRRER